MTVVPNCNRQLNYWCWCILSKEFSAVSDSEYFHWKLIAQEDAPSENCYYFTNKSTLRQYTNNAQSKLTFVVAKMGYPQISRISSQIWHYHNFFCNFWLWFMTFGTDQFTDYLNLYSCKIEIVLFHHHCCCLSITLLYQSLFPYGSINSAFPQLMLNLLQ